MLKLRLLIILFIKISLDVNFIMKLIKVMKTIHSIVTQVNKYIILIFLLMLRIS
jgi:hypothetical protein